MPMILTRTFLNLKSPQNSSNEQLIYKYLSQELALDGIPTLNLASFVNTYVDDTSARLIQDNLTKTWQTMMNTQV